MSSRPSQPLVSVVIPSYNHAAFLETTIKSVIAQSHRPLELIVVDDGSTDGSRDLLRELLSDIPLDRVQLIEQPNSGAHAAIMRGVEASSADILAILNSDDFFHATRIERMLPFLLAGKHQLAFSRVSFVDTNGHPLPQSNAWPRWYRRCREETVRCPTLGFALLVHNFSVSSGNFLFTRLLYDRLSGFSGHRFTHDWDFLIRSLYYSEPALVREPLLSYRIHETNTTESVRELLFSEGSDALQRYASLARRGPTPNPLAPCPANWPRFFPRFAQSYSLPFADDRNLVLDIWSAA